MFSIAVVIVLGLCAAGFAFARYRVVQMATRTGARLHSLPKYYGTLVALWTGIPSLFLLILWVMLQSSAVDNMVLASMPDHITEPLDSANRSLLISEIRSVAAGRLFSQPSPEVVAAAERLNAWRGTAQWLMVVVGTSLALAGLVFTQRRLSPAFRAREGVERIMDGAIIACAVVAILTTLGILGSLLYEAARFFERVPVLEFFFGLRWEPQIPLRADQIAGAGAFGAVPVFTGTLLVAAICMAVALPIGLFAAVYTAEYASDHMRSIVKPIIEILAGIPTIVYGFFAVLTIAPALREFGAAVGLDVAPNSALAAGAVMGIMVLPFISSITDDAISAVPQAMRDGAYALGATKAETIIRVLLPSALPGIVGGVLLAVSRAIGETMIVVMAAGLIANLTFNPLDAVTTVTVQIVTLLIGDSEFDSPKTLAAFSLGLTLFIATLALNITALRIVQKYRERYE